jgi:hypothetical protein
MAASGNARANWHQNLWSCEVKTSRGQWWTAASRSLNLRVVGSIPTGSPLSTKYLADFFHSPSAPLLHNHALCAFRLELLEDQAGVLVDVDHARRGIGGICETGDFARLYLAGTQTSEHDAMARFEARQTALQRLATDVTTGQQKGDSRIMKGSLGSAVRIRRSRPSFTRVAAP